MFVLRAIFLLALALTPCYAQQPDEVMGHGDPAVQIEAPEHKKAILKPRVKKSHARTVNARARRNLGRLEGPPPPGVGYKLTVHSTAYCLRGFTARGTQVRYGTVAVDPRVIPFGSKIYIPGYGWGVALDTGGAIQGNIVDVWLPTASQCYAWGNRRVTITVLPR